MGHLGWFPVSDISRKLVRHPLGMYALRCTSKPRQSAHIYIYLYIPIYVRVCIHTRIDTQDIQTSATDMFWLIQLQFTGFETNLLRHLLQVSSGFPWIDFIWKVPGMQQQWQIPCVGEQLSDSLSNRLCCWQHIWLVDSNNYVLFSTCLNQSKAVLCHGPW